MSPILAFAVEFFCTLLITALLFAFLRSSLQRILVDLCGGEARARFWTTFSWLLMVGLPAVAALGYRPFAASSDSIFFDLTHQLSQNLLTFLIALVGLGFVVGFFALVAPRPPKEMPS